MKIDAHQHFWIYDPVQYGWIDESMASIRGDFLPAHLCPLLEETGISGTIAVQARQSLEETDWLLSLAGSHPSIIKGVVGWAPLRDMGASVSGLLEGYKGHPALKGFRHVLQAEPDEYMEDANFHEALRELTAHGMTYDLLIFARQLPSAIAMIDRHPKLSVVLDHIAKPVVQGPPPGDWVKHVQELARRDHVACKFSGVVTEVPNWKWSPELLKPYFDVVLEAFGPKRVMFGSDWPVCSVAADYVTWHHVVEGFAKRLSADEQAAIFGGNAANFYKI